MSKNYDEWLREKGIQHEFLYFNAPVKTAEQARNLSGEKNIIKTIVAVSEGKPVLCVVPGEKKVDFSKLPEGARMATPSEVREMTGFPPGGVPPIIEGIETIIDESIAGMEWVVGGGGDENTLLKIRAKDLIEQPGSRVMKIS